MPGSSYTIDDSDLGQRITINALFASKIQQDVAMRLLRQFLGAWRKNVEAADKGNQVTITEHGKVDK